MMEPQVFFGKKVDGPEGAVYHRRGMEVVVDGKTGLMTPDAGTTLQAVLEALRRNMSSRRRVIVSFTLDGEKIDLEKLGARGEQPPGNFGLLEIKTSDPFQFSVGTLSG